MITKSKVTEFFCIVGTSAKILMLRWQNIRLKQTKDINITVKAGYTKTEVVILIIPFHCFS